MKDFYSVTTTKKSLYNLATNKIGCRSPSCRQVFYLTFLLVAILFVGDCYARTLTASWYSVESLHKDGQWKLTQGRMANGRQFSDDKLTAASWDYPLGTKVKVSTKKASVVVSITDRTARRFKGKRIDCSKAAFGRIADIKQGTCKVEVTDDI